MGPPSASLEHGTFDVVGGVKPFTSAACENNIPQSLELVFSAAFIVYNIAFLLDIDLSAIFNFSTMTYRTVIQWIGFSRRKGIRATFLAVAKSTGNWIKVTYRLKMQAHALRTGLEHMIAKPSEHLGRTVLVDTVVLPNAGSLALIRGLPSDVSAPELRRYLESTLFIQYRNADHEAARAATWPGSDGTEEAPIDTPRPSLWNVHCVCPWEDNVNTPSTPGTNKPAQTPLLQAPPPSTLDLMPLFPVPDRRN